jgi:hydroxymethylglutaryl-CoA lyase
MTQRLYFNEVVTRDGFQNEPVFIPTDAKVALIDALSACGYARIEVTSFTSPKAIPMLRDAEEVMGRIRRVAGVATTVLVPNRRGAERALEARADEFNLVMSVSETHNRSNLHLRGREFEPKAHLPVPGALDLCFIASLPLDAVIARLGEAGWPSKELDDWGRVITGSKITLD